MRETIKTKLESLRGGVPISVEWVYSAIRHYQRNVDYEPPTDGRNLGRYDGTAVAEILNGLHEHGTLDADIFLQLLRSLEERLGHSAGALNKDLIKQAYNHYNKVMGTDLKPSYYA